MCKNIVLYSLSFVLLFCSGCNNKITPGDSTPLPSDSSRIQDADEPNEDYSRLNYSYTASEGTYMIQPVFSSNGKGASLHFSNELVKHISHCLLYYYDCGINDYFVLCNKPNCQHSSNDCNAYIPALMMDGIGICKIGDNIYILSPNFGEPSSLIKMNKDGSNKETVLTIPDKYRISECCVYKNSIYFHAEYLDVDDKMTSVKKIGLFNADIFSGSIKNIYNYEKQDGDERLIGMYDNQAYYWYKSPMNPLTNRTQSGLDQQMNNVSSSIYFRNMMTGEKSVLFDTTSHYIDPVFMYDNYVIYHSRINQQLIQYDIISKKSDTLIENAAGYIGFLDNKLYDNKFFYIKNHEMTNAYSNSSQINEVFFFDLTDGSNHKVEHVIEQSNGKPMPFYGFAAIMSDEFIINTSVDYDLQGYPLKYRYGKISKQDFWDNKLDKVVDCNWLSIYDD